MEMNGKTVWIIGATSSLAQSICQLLAQKGYALVLSGRDAYELELLRSDLVTRHRSDCRVVMCDFLAADFSPAALVSQAGEFDHVILATGDMGSGDADSIDNLAYVTYLNYTAPAQIALLAAQALRQQEDGSVVIISSIAGDRGRGSNFAYGSAKAALTAFASGLRNRYCKLGVHVATVKPGFTDTTMTWGMKTPLMASRESVAKKIVRAMEKQKNVIYAPWFWRWIMLIIRHIPEAIFKRLSL